MDALEISNKRLEKLLNLRPSLSTEQTIALAQAYAAIAQAVALERNNELFEERNRLLQRSLDLQAEGNQIAIPREDFIQAVIQEAIERIIREHLEQLMAEETGENA